MSHLAYITSKTAFNLEFEALKYNLGIDNKHECIWSLLGIND